MDYYVANLPLETGQLRKIKDWLDYCMGTQRKGEVVVCAISFKTGRLRLMALPEELGKKFDELYRSQMSPHQKDDCGDL